ncbi:hypothetical protein AVEN_107948-1 [Araneus ventricosus]|uniref:Uncharacterized protein n=1 Tax=Araneus ventricosus TaxID=182803 RepID=A0A4Y2JIW6_ARAVE|nr:hypothetical protein AVEN_107948-1 [Araneus ventricosus]
MRRIHLISSFLNRGHILLTTYEISTIKRDNFFKKIAGGAAALQSQRTSRHWLHLITYSLVPRSIMTKKRRRNRGDTGVALLQQQHLRETLPLPPKPHLWVINKTLRQAARMIDSGDSS